MTLLFWLLWTPVADVQQCGHDDYRTRERATARLVRQGWLARPAMLCGLWSEDAEVRKRCRVAFHRQYAVSLEGARKRVDAAFAPDDFPFLDSLWYDAETKSYRVPGELFANWQPLINWCRENPDARFCKAYGNCRQATYEWTVLGVGWGVPIVFYRIVFVELRRRDAVFLQGQQQQGAAP